METKLTRDIKLATHSYKPKMNTGKVGRTIRYADEVWTPNGIVDSIRFEDYVSDVKTDCKRINYAAYPDDSLLLSLFSRNNAQPMGQCKVEGASFPCEHCKGCFFFVKELKQVDMMITAYEVKITLSDFKSSNGHNINDLLSPIGNENYYCVPSSLYNDIVSLVPEHVGILIYNGNHLQMKKPSAWLDVPDATKITLLYNAMKKWCDGAQT